MAGPRSESAWVLATLVILAAVVPSHGYALTCEGLGWDGVATKAPARGRTRRRRRWRCRGPRTAWPYMPSSACKAAEAPVPGQGCILARPTPTTHQQANDSVTARARRPTQRSPPSTALFLALASGLKIMGTKYTYTSQGKQYTVDVGCNQHPEAGWSATHPWVVTPTNS